jgi:hypothetical protein
MWTVTTVVDRFDISVNLREPGVISCCASVNSRVKMFRRVRDNERFAMGPMKFSEKNGRIGHLQNWLVGIPVRGRFVAEKADVLY